MTLTRVGFAWKPTMSLSTNAISFRVVLGKSVPKSFQGASRQYWSTVETRRI